MWVLLTGSRWASVFVLRHDPEPVRSLCHSVRTTWQILVMHSLNYEPVSQLVLIGLLPVGDRLALDFSSAKAWWNDFSFFLLAAPYCY
jgi:uncharacterized membrane protein